MNCARSRSRLDRKLTAGVLGLFLIPTLLAGAVLLVLYQRGIFHDAFALLITVVVGFTAMMTYLGVVAHGIGRSVVRTLHEIGLGTELIATVNPAHRLDIRTGDELQALAQEINRLADRLREERTERDGQVEQATATLRAERAMLSAVLDALGEAVAVAAPDGRVVLANRLAQALLGRGLLGRSVFDVLVSEHLKRCVERLVSDGAGAERFPARTVGGQAVDVVATPLVEGTRGTAGVVLILTASRWETPAAANALGPGLVGAGIASGMAAGGGPPAVDERPDFYDFSLFDEMDRAVAVVDRQRPLDELSCAVIDCETTGLEAERGDAIVSLAAVRVRAGIVKAGETFDALVNPARSIPSASVRFHGVTDAMVADAPTLDLVLPAFLRFVEGTVLVGHQVWFDLKFLTLATERRGLTALTRTHPVLDTLTLSEIVHGPLDGHGLDVVAARLGVAVRGRHSALGDAMITAEVFARLVPLLRKRGILTLGEALSASRRVRRYVPHRPVPHV